MLWLILGGAVLFVFLGGLRAFERASVPTIKSLLAWLAALGGLSLALMLILTGRGGIAIGALVMFGPLLWQQWKGIHPPAPGASPPGGPPRNTGPMSRTEAYEILGLAPGASEADIRAAHRRLMRGVHPDSGGSDWLATRINQARDVLLGLHNRR
ncbi:MAG: DnaJ domain-containing protein [Acetobacteraceae bacterium]|nr:DnaJ domain-containing protein [Acetobacteraceae bacterium]